MRIVDEPDSVLAVQVDESSGNFFIRGDARVVFVRTWFADRGWGVHERVWAVPVARAMLTDSSVDLRVVLGQIADMNLRPWAYPDRPSWPVFVFFPRIERLVSWWRRSRLERWWWMQRLKRRQR